MPNNDNTLYYSHHPTMEIVSSCSKLKELLLLSKCILEKCEMFLMTKITEFIRRMLKEHGTLVLISLIQD